MCGFYGYGEGGFAEFLRASFDFRGVGGEGVVADFWVRG